jgi:hypothetical protein
MAGETLIFGSTDISDVAHITLDGWAEILKGGPTNGDVIEFDFESTAEWEQGEPGTYSIVVPCVMISSDPETAWGDALALSGLRGVAADLTRVYSTDAGQLTESCQAVITGEVAMNWGPRSMVTAVLVFQILTEWETGSVWS